MNQYTTQTRLIIPALDPLYSFLSPAAVPMIRVFAGLILMPHGAQKLFGWFGGGGLEGTAQFFGNVLGLEPGMLFAVLVGATEFFGGLFLALGFLTRIAAAGATVVMLFAIVLVHLGNGFFNQNGGYEYPLLWGIVTLAFVFRGGGAWSLDRRIGREF
ncbi:MAG: DoxX family protein [Kiloniellales bacterium]